MVDRKRPATQCCCPRCDHYTTGCHKCCKCIPKKLCLHLKYSAANPEASCEQDTVSYSLPYDCENEVWTDADGIYEAWIQPTGDHSLDFDGTADYMMRAAAPLGNAGQWAIAVHFKTSASNGTIYCETATEEGTPSDEFARIRLRLVSGNVQINAQNALGQGVTVTTSGTYNDGEWHCAVVIFDHNVVAANHYRAFIYMDDGAETVSGSAGSYALSSDAGVVYVGCDWNHSADSRSDYFDGQLYMLTLYDATYTSSDNTAFCDCTDVTDGIVARWRMDQGSGTSSMPDIFGGFDLTMNSFTSGSWMLDVPADCDDVECYVYLQSDCLNSGYPLVVGMSVPTQSPTDANGPGCRYPDHTWEDVAVHADCRPGGTCTTADVQLVSNRQVKLPRRNGGCDYFCGTCDCVCRDLCVTLTVDGAEPGLPLIDQVCMSSPTCADTPTVTWSGTLTATNGGALSFSDTFTITLYPNATTGACEATIVGATIGSSGTLTGVGCPNLDIEHEFTVGDETWTVRARCSDCCTCASAVEVPCCADPIPETLNVTLTDASDCSCYDGLTGTITWSPADEWWIGTLTSAANCAAGEDETATITVKLLCDCTTGCAAADWSMLISESCSSGSRTDEPATINLGTLTCNPFYVFGEIASAVICCNGAVGQFYIEVSE